MKILLWVYGHRYTVLPVLAVVVALAAGAGPAFAQTSVPTNTLMIDTTMITSGLFQGANIMILALGAVIFLMAGFKFGAQLMQGILRLIGNISVG